MSAKKKVLVSRIDYRPDPADPNKNVINLGCLLEFTTKDYWAVAMVMFAALEDRALADLDQLTRRLIDGRQEVMVHEIRRILPRANKPGDALPLLAASNPWSVHIGMPTTLEFPTVRNADTVSVEKLAEKFALALFTRGHAPTKRTARVKSPARASLKPAAVRIIVPDDCPPPWILPPSCVLRPLHVR